MASSSSSALQKQRPLMLKDFLKEDQNADSSNGFRSAPRRAAAETTVRYLLSMEYPDGKVGGGNSRGVNRDRLTRSRSIGSTALTRISGVLKLLTTTTASTSTSSAKQGILQRSFSKKLLRKAFWKKCTFPSEEYERCHDKTASAGWGRGGAGGGKILVKDIVRLGSFVDEMRGGKLINFAPSPTSSSRNSCSCSTSGWSEMDFLSLSSSSSTTTPSGTDSVPSSSSPVPEFAKPKSPSPEKRRKPRSMSAPTSPSICAGAGAGEHLPNRPAATPATASRRDPKQEDEEEEEGSSRAGGDAGIECTCHDCEDKDQLSPVAVMDFPSEEEEEDDEEELEEETAWLTAGTPPSFRQSLANIERTRHQLLEKIRRFESLAHLVDPVDLDDAFEAEEDDDCDVVEEEEEEEEIEEEVQMRAREMLEHLKIECAAGNQNFSSEGILLDFFIQGLWRSDPCSGPGWRTSTKTWHDVESSAEDDLSFAARQWIEGKPRGDVATREALMKEMDREGRWGCLDEEVDEIGVALGEEVLGSLMDELLFDVLMV